MAKNTENNSYEDENMTVTMTLDDGTEVTCAIVTILEDQDKEYIVLLPLDENGENEDGEVWIYGYEEDENDPNKEPVITYIDDEEEYDRISDLFDQYLDDQEFDEILGDEE